MQGLFEVAAEKYKAQKQPQVLRRGTGQSAAGRLQRTTGGNGGSVKAGALPSVTSSRDDGGIAVQRDSGGGGSRVASGGNGSAAGATARSVNGGGKGDAPRTRGSGPFTKSQTAMLPTVRKEIDDW